MFNIDFESEKTKNTINFIKYGLTAVVVVVTTVLLVFAAGGYDIDKSTGEIIHNGLVLVASEPVPADVYVNGKAEKDRTKSKLSLPAGNYEIMLKHDGYYDWSKKINVEGSDVIWLYYPRLIPKEIKSINVEAFKNIDLTSQSPDRHSILLHEKGAANAFLLVDATDQESTAETIELPSDVFDIENSDISTYRVVDWAQDSKTVLVEHKEGSGSELLLFNTSKPQDAINLSKTFELKMSNLHFIDNSRDKLYAIVNSSLRRIDVKAKTISGALINDVSQYSSDNGYVAAVHGENDAPTISILDGDKLISFMDMQGKKENYKLKLERFDGDRYLAVVDNGTGFTSIYRNPLDVENHPEVKTEITKLRLSDVKYLSSSPNGQFIMVQSANSFRLYDLDTEAKRAFNSSLTISKETQAEWVDGYHLSLIDDKSDAYFLDYDGLNPHKIDTVNKKLGVFFTSDTEGMYCFSNTAETGSNILKYDSLLAE